MTGVMNTHTQIRTHTHTHTPTPASRLLLNALIAAFTLSCSFSAYAQTAAPDLDRDGIPNISDRDVDNDGILNGDDRNIDGGLARSGPFSGKYIGDKLPNDHMSEFDMDADGLADNALNETDIDGDGWADNHAMEFDIDGDGLADDALNETDMDADGLADNALNETDIDGDGLADDALNETDNDGDGLADNALNETDLDGDGLADDALNETDIDGDGLADNALNETDIDGDGLADNDAKEFDTDGDGIANGLDGNLDGDGLANGPDPDMYGTGHINDIFARDDLFFAPDETVMGIITYVSGEIRRRLQIPSTDAGLRVRVAPRHDGRIGGTWRYLSSDNMQVYSFWIYPANNPSDLNIAIRNSYDYVTAQWGIGTGSRVRASFPGGGGTFVDWAPAIPAEFRCAGLGRRGFAPPFQPLVKALSTYPNFISDENLEFTGNFSDAPGLPSLQPVIDLQRTLMKVSRAWYGQLEAQQLVLESQQLR